MRLYLLEDLTKQRQLVLKKLRKFLLFLLVLFLLDRAAGLFLLHGLEKYYGLANPAEVLLVGYSHMVLGVDKVLLEDKLGSPVAKYARAGATLRDREIMIKHYLSRNPKSVQTVVFGVDSRLFTQEDLSSNSYRLFYPYMEDPSIAAYLRKEVPSRWEYYPHKLMHTSRYSDVTLGLAIRGHRKDWGNYKNGQVNIELLKQELKEGKHQQIKFSEEQIEIFKRILSFLREQEIEVILAYIPTLDIYNAAEPDKHLKAIDIFKSVASQDAGIHYRDYNRDYSNRHELFHDHVHLNAEGQKLITNELINDLRLEGAPN
jgi:hypothetical protein